MINTRNLVISVCWLVLCTPWIGAQDLSKYREFELGMDVRAVAERIDARPSEVRVIHERPELIQELEWRPRESFTASHAADPVNEVLFSFYNGDLFRMVISYDPDKTEGLTDKDMIEAISETYGIATRPDAKVALFSTSHIYNEREKVMARWEDAQSSLSLFRSSSQRRFGMLILSKQQDALAQAAIVQAMQLDEQEAPQRAIDHQKREDARTQAARERARPTNKADFRP